jgi:hypothetical protein
MQYARLGETDLALDDHDLAEIERLTADRLEIGGASPQGVD